MDQELKQRLIGAAVITALAAIFVPMLFDDAVEETGKEVSTLTIPPLPAKEQEVEIAPLPEKVEDVAANQTANPPTEKSLKISPAVSEEGEPEVDVAPHKPITHLSSNSKPSTAAISAKHPQTAVIDAEQPVAEAEDVPPATLKPVKQPPVQTALTPASVVKNVKPVGKPVENVVEENAIKSNPATDTGTRWYLNAGSFSQKANALTLQDTLKQQGFATTLKEVTNEKGSVFKVRIGPMLDRAKAQAVKNKLSQINVNSFVSPDE